MKINRELQSKILVKMQAVYPELIEIQKEFENFNDFELHANLFYLEEHNLIEASAKRIEVFGAPCQIFTARITARGLDFIEDDGGLSAILNKITVSFDVENIKNLLSDKIFKLSIENNKKKTLIEKIKSMSSAAIQNICIKLIGKGIESVPEIIDKII
ncbi:MAG: hypothetical protein KAI72_09620 [Candidatus Pacebacteria bacterium]|nr:hypothetical protein [Candidatus Paceibacterota bacterium]